MFIQRIFYPTVDRINKVTCPILFIRGLKDEIVPCDQSKKLYDAAKSAKFKELHEVENGDHNRTWQQGGEPYVDSFRKFFEKAEKQK